MAPARVFVSYSRHDFHFAEALTAELNGSGRVRAWLDVENLRPGTDWSAAIDAALDEADALVLVASPAAMRSTYVRDEWRRALAAGTPVHVALVRATRLPAELSPFPVHDLRGDFRAAARRLAELPPTGRRSIPVAWPVALVHVALLLGVLGLGVGAAFARHLYDVFSTIGADPRGYIEARYAQWALALLSVDAMVALAVASLVPRFARRSASPMQLLFAFLGQLTTLSLTWLVGGLLAGTQGYQVTADPGPLAASRWPYLVGIVAAVVGIVLVRRSRTVHLRLPTGEDEYGARRLPVTPVGPPAEIATYEMLGEPADAPVDALFAATCARAGFRRHPVDPRWTFILPQWVFILVSSRSDLTMLARARDVFGDRVVFVLLTSLRMPEDSRELRRHQWIDFRRQDEAELLAQLRGIGTARATVPVAPERFRVPPHIAYFVRAALGLVAFSAGAPLALLVAGNVARAVLALLITVLLAVLLVPLAWRTVTRDVDAARWRRRVGWACVLFLVWHLQPLAGNHLPLLVRLVVITTLVILLIRSGRALARQWLPAAPLAGTPHLAPPVAPSLAAMPLSAFAVEFHFGYLNTLLFAW